VRVLPVVRRGAAYVLERGLDVADPRGGKVRDESYIPEFATVPTTLSDVLKLAATKPPG
jgi:hypothetical protein